MAQRLKLTSLRTDLRKEDEGDWVDSVSFGADGVRYLMRSPNSSDYRTAYAAAFKDLGAKYGRQPIPPDEVTVTVGGLMAKYLLRGWEGFDAESAYSPELAAATLTNLEYRDVIDDIASSATLVGRQKREYVEETAGN